MLYFLLGALMNLFFLALSLMTVAWVVRCVVRLRRDIGVYRDVPHMRAPLIAIWVFTTLLAAFLISRLFWATSPDYF
jgi:hypothetical protein